MEEELTRIVIDFVKTLGACETGIATVNTLAGGPPSTDLTYVLPNARSAISFSLHYDQSMIIPYLAKRDRLSHEKDNLGKMHQATGIAQGLADYLNQKGYPSVAVSANQVYRTDTPRGILDMYPPIAHRYLAVRSGMGWFGMSGNVITRSAGAGIMLASVVTCAELVPTDPLPANENYCDRCGMCAASCISKFFNHKEEEKVTLGGIEFSYSKRRDYSRCEYVCGGFSGLHASGKWSTWSPGRFPVPSSDDEIQDATVKAASLYSMWPQPEGGFYNGMAPWKLWLTCGNCCLVCVPDRKERERRFRSLRDGGVVVQNLNGSVEGVSTEKARIKLDSMTQEVRALYESIH